ncbi:MAG: DNA-binding protein [Acidilobaceae archaeon]
MSYSTGFDEDAGALELEELKRRKLEELKRRAEEEKKKLEAEERRRAILRSILTSEARARLENIRLVRPELAELAENYIIQLVSAGRLTPPIDEEFVKSLLAELDSRSRREYKITFRRK